MFLEGLEVAFIVLTFGSTQGSIPLAAVGAARRARARRRSGVAARAPLARVPENTMKFAVGIMLTTFGVFWSAEGAGAHWPGGDAAILGVLAGVIAWSAFLVAMLRRRHAELARRMNGIVAFGRFWWDFVIGDDWVAAVGVLAGLVVTALVAAWWVLPPAVALVLALTLVRATRNS